MPTFRRVPTEDAHVKAYLRAGFNANAPRLSPKPPRGPLAPLRGDYLERQSENSMEIGSRDGASSP